MWEVGERFERLHVALERGNYSLASYHWGKIRTTIENGIANGPKRRPNAEGLFLAPVREDVEADLKSADARRAWAGFERAKAACQACHEADEVAYMNDQPLFDLAAPPASANRQ